MECKLKLICVIHILNLHAVWAARVLSWEVDTSNLEQSTIGGTLKLICNGTGTSCCSGLREWKGGPGFTSLLNNGAPSDASKYAEEVGSNYFSLVIKNLEDSDFQIDYQCFHDFDDSPRNQLNPGTVFHYTPDHTDIQVISKLDTDGGDLSYAVNVTKVYPKPTCFAMFQNDNITNYMDVNVIDDPSVFMYCEVNVTDAKYSCPGSLEISCNAPPFVSFSINPTSPCLTTVLPTLQHSPTSNNTSPTTTSMSTQTKQTCWCLTFFPGVIVCFVIPFLIIIMIIILIIWQRRKKATDNNLEVGISPVKKHTDTEESHSL